LLTTQSADVGILEKIKDSKFKEAFNNHKLLVVDVSSVLTRYHSLVVAKKRNDGVRMRRKESKEHGLGDDKTS
jgi:anthranilate/para-aminobenzoate synthase component II